MKGIIWLASYPKSGNTWLRIFLTNLERDEETPASVNELAFASGPSARAHFDEAVGYKAADLTFDEIDRLRPEVYVYESGVREEAFYSKVHDAFAILPDGRPLFPPQVSLRAVYLVRNPLDVCVSFAHHLGGTDLDTMIASMADPAFALGACTRTLGPQLRQRLRTWSGHVLSWVDGFPKPVHVMRYEDMKRSPAETFTACAKFLSAPRPGADRPRARGERFRGPATAGERGWIQGGEGWPVLLPGGTGGLVARRSDAGAGRADRPRSSGSHAALRLSDRRRRARVLDAFTGRRTRAPRARAGVALHEVGEWCPHS